MKKVSFQRIAEYQKGGEMGVGRRGSGFHVATCRNMKQACLFSYLFVGKWLPGQLDVLPDPMRGAGLFDWNTQLSYNLAQRDEEG